MTTLQDVLGVGISRRRVLGTAAGIISGTTIGTSHPGSALGAPLASSVGAWSAIYPWPKVGIHMHLLPNSKVLTWSDAEGGGQNASGFVNAYVVDVPNGQPPSNPIFVPNTKTNLFCAGHTFLADGRLFISGGHAGKNYYGVADVNIFDFAGPNTWQTITGFPISNARWYGSAITLADGQALVLGGTILGSGDYNQMPQVWGPDRGSFRDLTSALLKLQSYPKVYLAPNGLVAHVGREAVTSFLDTSGTGRWITGPRHLVASRAVGSSALYDDGKVLVMGGGGAVATKTAETLDLNVSTSEWKYTGAMAYGRKFLNATVLPDGQVLVTGGSSSAGFNDAAGAILPAEMWNPATGAWTTMASMKVPRIYHSNAFLLPDGRVLCAGGGRPAATNGGKNNLNCEIYSPPYLFKGPRPVITSAPTSVTYGQTFTIGTPDAAGIAKARFLGMASVTHTFNATQRLTNLTYARTESGLNITVPSNPNLLPPGHYMLFILNATGVPSVSKVIRVS